MKFNDLKKDKKINEWLDTVNPKPSTEKNYLRAMGKYTEWMDKSPIELYTEAIADIKAGLLPTERGIKGNLNGFRRHLMKQNLSPMSVKTYMTGVTNFYKSFDIDIPKTPRSETRAQPLEENCEIPTKEDLQEVLKICDPLEKAILLTGIASGLSAQEIINLKIKDFTKGYDPEIEITTLKLRREKVKFNFITFLSPEASRAINEYLEYRNRKHNTGDVRRINQIKKQNVFSENGYLFICRLIPDEFLKSNNEELRKLGGSTLLKIYRTISEKARKSTPQGHWNLIRSHNIRKYFNSSLRNAGADTFHTEFFMGHKLDDTQGAYFNPDPKKLREIYQKYVPYLTIEKQLDISESPEYVRIKDENQILQAETARNVVERSELQELRAEVEAEKKAKEEEKQAWKSEVMGELEKKLLDALAVNEQEVNEWYGEPGPFIFEPGEMPDIPSGSDPLQGLELAVKEIGNLPEEFPDIIERIFKPKGKKE
jgi:integrase